MAITALTVSILAGGKIGSVVRRHNSPAFALRYAEGRQAEAKQNGNGKEYGVVILPVGSGWTRLDQSSETSAQPSTRGRYGAKRFPFAAVKLSTRTSSGIGDGKSVSLLGIVARRSTFLKAVESANKSANATGYNTGVLIRTATRGGEFPKFKNA